MQDLINKLSKIDQRNVKMALIHATTGNYRSLDSMIRAANTRSQATLVAIRALMTAAAQAQKAHDYLVEKEKAAVKKVA